MNQNEAFWSLRKKNIRDFLIHYVIYIISVKLSLSEAKGPTTLSLVVLCLFIFARLLRLGSLGRASASE